MSAPARPVPKTLHPLPPKTHEDGYEWGTIRHFVEDFVDGRGEEVLIAGKPLSHWVDTYGLPLHIQYAPAMIQKVREFKAVFADLYPKGEIRFAGKVNCHPEIFRLMKEEGIGVDVASKYELEAALDARCGIDPFVLDINGNSKSDELIRGAIERNCFLIADSFEELDVIERIARELHCGKDGPDGLPRARVALRVAGFDLGGCTADAVFTAGVWSKFGCDFRLIEGFLKTLAAERRSLLEVVDFQGFHAHIGSQVTERKAFLVVITKLLELSAMMPSLAGLPCKIVNMGGGFPTEYVDREEWQYLLGRLADGYRAWKEDGDASALFSWKGTPGSFHQRPDGTYDLTDWRGECMHSDFPESKMLEAVLKGEIQFAGKTTTIVDVLRDVLGEPRLVIEPGRSIAGASGVTLSQVGLVRKVAGGHNLITLEANVTNFATAMLLPPVNGWTILTDHRRQDDQPFETFVAGNLCYSGDIISQFKVFLQRAPVRGDVLCSFHTGAYDPNFFSANTNSFPRPARVLVEEGGVVTMIKERDTYPDLFSLPQDTPTPVVDVRDGEKEPDAKKRKVEE